MADRVAVGEIENELVYDAKLNGYYLKTTDERTLSNSEIFAVCKILLESRAFCKSDIEPIIKKLIFNCIPKSKHSAVRDLLSNEICYEEETVICEHCGERIWAENAADCNITLCQSCYDDCYTNCEHCGRTIHYDDAYYFDDDYEYPYCHDCYNERKITNTFMTIITNPPQFSM